MCGPKKRHGYLYALLAKDASPPDWALTTAQREAWGGAQPGIIKLGYSTRPERRFVDLDSMSPGSLALLWTLPGATLFLEGLLHRSMRRWRTRGPGNGRGREWYCLPLDEISEIPRTFTNTYEFVEHSIHFDRAHPRHPFMEVSPSLARRIASFHLSVAWEKSRPLLQAAQ